MKKITLGIIALIVLILPVMSFGQSSQTVTIAAAADLRFAMDSLISIFRKSNSNVDIKVIYGSSGQFFQQAISGAPFDIFFSADTSYPDQLKTKGLTTSDVVIYGEGHLVIWSKKIDPSISQMNSLLVPSVKKIAIANPDHAPYGKRARESLIHYGIYDKIKDKLVMGENISQTAQFVTSGAADIGIIALSLAVSPAMQKENGKYWPIPDNSHQSLLQAFAILKHAENNNVAKQFSAFATSKQAKDIFRHFGITGR